MIISQINQLIKEIKLKAAAEQKYYQGALDSLTLLLSEISKHSAEENKENDYGCTVEEKND